MKRNTLGRAALATVMSLALGLGITACSRDYTVAYVYSASAGNQNVAAFAVDYQSGSLTQLAGSPFALNGRQPVAMVTAPNSKYLYVISNFDATVETFSIGTDGKLYALPDVNVIGSFPKAVAIDPTGAFLYVAVTLQPGYTPIANPGPGSINIFPINSDGTLGTPTVQLVGNNPVGVTVANLQACTALSGNCSSLPAPCNTTTTSSPSMCRYVYVVDQEAGHGQLLSFLQQTTNGALTAAPGTTIGATNPTVATGANVGVTPSGIAVEPTSRFLYATDQTSNLIYGYQIQSTGAILPLSSSPFNTGLFPVALTIDPRGKFLYTANFSASSVGVYNISPVDGSLSGVVGGTNNSVATGPTCVTIEPALGIYLYTSNKLDNSISGAQLDSHTGSLSAIQNTPFSVGSLPTCVAAAANGAHASSLVNP